MLRKFLEVRAAEGIRPIDIHASLGVQGTLWYKQMLCWRDYEAVMSGSVLLKPNMSHIETNPDVFVAGKTYMPARWDLADFEEKTRLLIEAPSLRAEISNNAFSVSHHYLLKEEKFVNQFGPTLA